MNLNKYFVSAAIILMVGLTGTVKSQRVVKMHNPVAGHPVLNNINTIYAFVISESPDLKKTELAKRLESAAEQKLMGAGFKIGEKGDFENRPVPFEIPELRIYIELLKIDANQCVIYTKTSLAKTIFLNNRGNLYTKANLWYAMPVLQSVPAPTTQELEMKLNEVVESETEKFIKAYTDASKDVNGSVSDANTPDTNTVRKPSPRAVRRNVREEPNEQKVEEKYISSKNSKIFHRPNCPAAGRIKEENQVIYSTKDEAINAGKIACRLCKP